MTADSGFEKLRPPLADGSYLLATLHGDKLGFDFRLLIMTG
jgi:hypothetical protein